MRRTPLLVAAVLSMALPSFAVTAHADGPVTAHAVSNAYEEARHRVDIADRRMAEARDARPADPTLWEDARSAVETALQQLVTARRTLNEGKSQQNVGSNMGSSILHGIANDLRRLAEIQRSIPAAVLPPVAESTPQTQRASATALTEVARGLEGEIERFRKQFGGKPANAMDGAADALRQIRELLAAAQRNPNVRASLPAALEKARAFYARHQVEWFALLATLEEIQHLRNQLPAPKPKGGGLVGAAQGVADTIETGNLRTRIAESEAVANRIATTPLSLR